MLGLTGMGGGVASLMWAGAGETLYRIFVWGNNSSPQSARLGLNNATDRSSPVLLGGAGNETTYKGLYTGETYNREATGALRVIDGENQLWVWGSNTYGALGLNGANNLNDSWALSSPAQLPGDWINYSRARNSSIGTKSDGTLWGWGKILSFRNVPTATSQVSSPMQIGSDTDWPTQDPFETGDCHLSSVSPGYNFAIKQNGSLWVWAAQNAGAGVLGLNDMANPQPTRLSRSSPRQIGTETTWKSIAASAGPGSVFAIKTDGSAWAWGNGRFGQLGLNQGGPSARVSSPVRIGYNTNWKKFSGCPYGTNFGLKTDGTLWSWGGYVNYGSGGINKGGNAPPSERYKSSPTQIPGTNWTDVQSGLYAGYGLKSDGSGWAWGRNHEGQLGLNDKTDRSSPTQIPGTWGGTGVAFGNISGGKSMQMGFLQA